MNRKLILLFFLIGVCLIVYGIPLTYTSQLTLVEYGTFTVHKYVVPLEQTMQGIILIFMGFAFLIVPCFIPEKRKR